MNTENLKELAKVKQCISQLTSTLSRIQEEEKTYLDAVLDCDDQNKSEQVIDLLEHAILNLSETEGFIYKTIIL
jgi:hypothetical protein